MAHHPDFPAEEEVEEVGAQEAFAPFQKMLQFALEPLLLAGASMPVPEPPGTAPFVTRHEQPFTGAPYKLWLFRHPKLLILDILCSKSGMMTSCCQCRENPHLHAFAGSPRGTTP